MLLSNLIVTTLKVISCYSDKGFYTNDAGVNMVSFYIVIHGQTLLNSLDRAQGRAGRRVFCIAE